MNLETLSQAKELIEKGKSFNLDESFLIAQICAQGLRNLNEEWTARDTIIRVLDRLHQLHPSTHILWNDIVESAGLYPYLNIESLYGAPLLRLEYNKSRHIPEIIPVRLSQG